MKNRQPTVTLGSLLIVGALLAPGCVEEEPAEVTVEVPGEGIPSDDAAGEPMGGAPDEDAPEATERFVDVPADRGLGEIVTPEPRTCEANTSPRWSLDLVRVAGRVTLDGGLRPGSEGELGRGEEGRLVFTDVTTGKRYNAPLRVEGGEEVYDTELFAGRYDVTLERVNGEQDCYWGCPLTRLEAAFDPTTARSMDFDLASAWVTVSVRLDGGPVPEEGGRDARGHLLFREQGAQARIAAPLPSTGEATAEVRLIEGVTYDALWVTGGRWSDPVSPRSLPLGIAELGSVTPVPGVERLEFDVSTVEVSGEVTLAGEALPDDGILDGAPRATLYFSRAGEFAYEDQRFAAVTLGEQGRARFQARLFPGAYKAWILTEDDARQDALPEHADATLCGGGAPACVVSADAPAELALDVDPEVSARFRVEPERVQVVGRVVWEGEPSPGQEDAPYAGHIRFVHRDSGYSSSGTVRASGAFSVGLRPGEVYDVQLLGNNPHGFAVLARGVVAEPEVELELRARVVRLQGEVLVNGAPMPDKGWSGDPRAHLRLIGVDADAGEYLGRVDLDLGHEGRARFDALVLEGEYEVRLVTLWEGRAIWEFEQDVLPRGVKAIGVVDAREGVEHLLDVSVRRVQGAVALDGAVPTTTTGWEAMLRLTPEEDLGYPFWAPLSQEGEFDLLLYEGNYAAEIGLRTDLGWDAEAYASDGPFGRTWLGPLCVE